MRSAGERPIELPFDLEEGRIYETIATFEPTGTGWTNATALGIWVVDDRICFRSFAGSNLYDQIRSSLGIIGDRQHLREPELLCINLPDHDRIDLLAYAALRGWGNEEEELPSACVDHLNLEGRSVPMISVLPSIIVEIEGAIPSTVTDDLGTSSVLGVSTRPVKVLGPNSGWTGPLTRNDSNLIQALVLRTRMRVLTHRLTSGGTENEDADAGSFGSRLEEITNELDSILIEVEASGNETEVHIASFIRKY